MPFAFLSFYADLCKTREKIFFLIKKVWRCHTFCPFNRSPPYFFSILTLYILSIHLLNKCQRHLILYILLLVLCSYNIMNHWLFLFCLSGHHISLWAQARASVPKYSIASCEAIQWSQYWALCPLIIFWYCVLVLCSYKIMNHSFSCLV